MSLFFDEEHKKELTEYIDGSELEAGDAIISIGAPKIIREFAPYNGPLNFVNRIAVFTDGHKMSISEGSKYQVYRKR